MALMAFATARPRKTVEDLFALPEGVRAELIGGDLYVTPSPESRHQAVSSALHFRLADHVRRSSGGSVFSAPLDVHLPSGDVVQPDLIWVSTERAGIVQRWIYGAPDLLVEILSPSNPERDRIVKRDLYARNGVREYWIVDPEARSIEVFVVESGVCRPAGWFTPGTQLVSPTLPGLSIDIAETLPAPARS
jgi:Uma2 family endonuclease